MGSRKDLIKRHLGITEYPWSSDDELEGATHAAEESSLRRQAAEIRPTIPDAPGTSGDPPQPMPPMVPQQQQHQPSQLQQQQQHQQQQHQQQQHQQQHHQQQLEHHHHHHQQQERFDHQLQQLQLQQQQLHQEVNATWHQARADLCRSIANSAPRLPSHRVSAHSSRVHANEMPMSYVSRVNHVPAQELSEHSAERSEADIQRMIAFKRLTRNLGSLRHRAHIAGVIPVTRVNPGVIVPSEANSSYRSSRHIPIRRYLRIGPYGPLPLRSGYLSSSSPGDRPTPMGTLQNRSGQSEHDELIDEDHPIPPQPQPPIPGPSTEDEVNNNPIPLPATADLVVSDDGNVVLDVQLQQELDAEASANHSSANATLQDEIDAMAFDNREVTAPVSTVEEEEEEEEVTDRRAESSTEDAAGPSGAHFSMALHGSGSDRNMPSTSSETVDADPQQPPRHSVKRRRDDVDIRLDAFSIQEFNQNLLRLLECPVCLDWMEPPMSQCQRGHLVCGRCRARLAACPVCRTSFSSVRNRAMEGVAEMLRYPCRHGCGREVRLRRRAAHESSCTSRKYQCPAPVCVGAVPMPREMLPHHFQNLHLTMMRIGRHHKFSMKVNAEQHDNWIIFAMEEYFHLRINVDIRTWGVIAYASYIGPKCEANNYTYEVTVEGRANQRKLSYVRTTHSDLESSSLNVCRQDCFHLTLDQALHFIRFKNHTEKYIDFNVVISRVEQPVAAEAGREESHS